MHYFCYLIRHKALILVLAPRWHVPLWQALIHDLSRFLPTEFIPSARHFAIYGYTWRRGDDPPYDRARDLHERRNPHHAPYWQGKPMPPRYIHEMLCDWDAAGQVKGKPIGPWYAANRNRLGLHPETLVYIDKVLKVEVHV